MQPRATSTLKQYRLPTAPAHHPYSHPCEISPPSLASISAASPARQPKPRRANARFLLAGASGSVAGVLCGNESTLASPSQPRHPWTRATAGALGSFLLVSVIATDRAALHPAGRTLRFAPTRGQACGARRRNRSKKHFAGGERHPRYPGAFLVMRGGGRRRNRTSTGAATTPHLPRQPTVHRQTNRLMRVVGAGGRVKRTPHLPPPLKTRRPCLC